MRHLKLLLVVISVMVFANVPAATKDYALHQAVLDNDLQLTRLLLSKGAAIDVIGSRKYGYGSALHIAVREGHLEIAKLLIKRGAEVDVLDPDDFTPLHNAMWNGNLEMVKLLLDAGADMHASTYEGDTPLSLAKQNDRSEVAAFFEARLRPSVVLARPSQDKTVVDISGTYVVTKLTASLFTLRKFMNDSSIKSKDSLEFKIVQNGNQITATYGIDGKGKIWGDIEGDKIKFDWTGFDGYYGTGRWRFKPESNELIGDITTAGYGAGGSVPEENILNLVKIESEVAQVPDISGTYIAEITGGGSGPCNKKKFVKQVKGKLIVLKQTGDTITGGFSSLSYWRIEGTREGNIVNFYVIAGNEIIGSWEINADATNLEGKWFSAGCGSGEWNLTKIESEPAQVVDVSGTYTNTELIYLDETARSWYRWYFGNGSNLKITLEQEGDVITGAISGDASGKIKGSVQGNKISFDYDVVSTSGTSTYGDASLSISSDHAELTGKFIMLRTSHGNINGEWKFRKIEASER